MKVLHITSITNPNGNGVAVAVSNYFKYENNYIDVAIYNTENNIISNDYSYNILEYKNISSLPNGFNSPDLVVFNEVYKATYLNLYKECIDKKIPYIIIPHGCLTQKSQNKKKIKKVLANLLFFNKFINSSVAIQYLNEEEKNSSIIKKHQYIISGNGIEISKEKNKNINKDFVYIGRYDINVKGLDLLINMIVDNKKWFIKNNVKIQLYGRNSGNGYEILKKMISDNCISDILVLNDAVYDNEKKRILLESYVFIQVSRHEGQPMGIMEALSYGLPCIVTHGTTFGKYINNNNCGIGIDFDGDELFDAIKKMFENENFRNICSENTKKIEKDFEWKNVIKKCLKEYKELL